MCLGEIGNVPTNDTQRIMPPHDLTTGASEEELGSIDVDGGIDTGIDEALPLHKASRRTGFGRVMRDAANTCNISLPLNWHSNCNVAHEANCDKEPKDSGSREKLHSDCDSASTGTTMRHMSIARRI